MKKWWVPIFLVLSLATAAFAVACENFPLDLGVSYHEEALLNGLYLMEYDRNGDGGPDYAVLFQILGNTWDGAVTKTLPHPLFYWVDTDRSGSYDETWIDQEGKGQCQDIVRYWAGRN